MFNTDQKTFNVLVTKIKETSQNLENDCKNIQFNIKDEMLQIYSQKAIYRQKLILDKEYLINTFQRYNFENVDIKIIIESEENAKKLLKEYRHIQNLIEKEYFSRY